MAVHRIRLGPPWQVTQADGRSRHARKFGRPPTTSPAERIWVVCESVPAAATIMLNGTSIGASEPDTPFAADVTDRLQPRNELTFAIASDASIGLVALEIRTPEATQPSADSASA